MSPVSNPAAAAPALRRRLHAALAAATRARSHAMRRPGKLPLRPGTTVAHSTADTPVSTPPAVVRWLSKASFGYSQDFRADFDARPGGSDAERWQSWVDWQLAPSAIADSDCDARLASGNFLTLDKTLPRLWADHHESDDYTTRMLPIAESECTAMIRAIYSRRQLFETLVDFWHDHFSVFGWDYDGGPLFVHYDRDVIRAGALGNFREMLENVGRSTTMMYYLDLYASTRAGPNENYSREVFELHTLGSESYAGVISNPDSAANLALLGTFTAWDGTEQRLRYVDEDVYETTRALSGWSIKNGNWQYPDDDDGTFVYHDAWHDNFPKNILYRHFNAYGRQNDGFTLYDMLASHPGTAHHVAGKLCRRLVSDSPSAALVNEATQIFNQQWQADDQIAQVVRHILLSNEFAEAWGGKLRRPFDSFAAALRGSGGEFNPDTADIAGQWTATDELLSRLQSAGQRPFYWPAPNGYPDRAGAWSSSGAMALTWKLMGRLTAMHQDVGYDDARPYLIDIVGQTQSAIAVSARSGDAIADYWCDRVYGWRPEPVRDKAAAFMRQNAATGEALDISVNEWHGNDLKRHYTQDRLRAMLALLLSAPDFMRR